MANITYEQSETLVVSDRIIVMNAGHIAQHGTLQVMYQNPNNALVAEFMCHATLLEVVVSGALCAAAIAIQLACTQH